MSGTLLRFMAFHQFHNVGGQCRRKMAHIPQLIMIKQKSAVNPGNTFHLRTQCNANTKVSQQ